MIFLYHQYFYSLFESFLIGTYTVIADNAHGSAECTTNVKYALRRVRSLNESVYGSETSVDTARTESDTRSRRWDSENSESDVTVKSYDLHIQSTDTETEL
jgi:hypothetical protein